MNRAQFIESVKSEQRELRRFLLALCCGNHFEADDIAQETLIKAYLSSAGYQEEGHFVSWLYKIAYRTFLDSKRAHRISIPLDEAASLTEPQYNADVAFRYQDLYIALEGLSPKERTSILLFYLKGYSIKEICKIIECSEEAVKKQLSRGREHLKLKLKR